MTFEEIGIENKYIRAVEELGFKNPMPVQEQVIPHLIENDTIDIIALAQTGTGKTAAFGLPLIQKTNPVQKHVQHLILCPTRDVSMPKEAEEENVEMQEGTNKSFWSMILDFLFSLFGGKK